MSIKCSSPTSHHPGSCAAQHHRRGEIHSTAVALLEEMGTTAPVRLLGVRVEGLSGATDAEQLTLDDVRPTSRWRDAEVAVDSARSKFGAAAVRPASLLARNAD